MQITTCIHPNILQGTFLQLSLFPSSSLPSLSDPSLLSSGPSVMATSPPTSSGGVVTVSWSYAHTGGLPLTRVLVQYQSVPDGMLMTPPGGNVSNPLSSFTSLAVEGLIAGDKYQFSVTASNAEGSSVSVLPVLSLTVGEPERERERERGGGGGGERGREREERER